MAMKSDKAQGLVPTPAAGRPLSQAQEAFRSLLARVESLRESIDTEEEKLDATLNFYAAEIVPRLARQAALWKELVRALAPHVNKTFLPRKQERLEMKEMIQRLLDDIAKAERGLTDADLREIYGTVHGIGYAEREQETLASVKAALARMFDEEGLEADFSELESAASEADFMAKAEELTARVRKMKEAEADEAHCRDAGHHPSQDAEFRAAEEFRKRSIANIYKQLARVLHPDFERDSGRQKQKVQLMQELTVAFRQNDLHTLLRLEMEWIKNEGGNLERLTEEKLGVYNEVLADQVEGLERRLRDLALHPRYRPVVVFNYGLLQTIDGPAAARDLDESITEMERSLALMGTIKTAEDMHKAVSPFRTAAQFPHT
jgi:DNA repair exonuclease SbcCD ATPase subunit